MEQNSYIYGGLLQDQLDKAVLAGDKYAGVRPEDVFGPKSNSLLSQQLYREDAVSYRRLKLQYAINCGEIPGDVLGQEA